MTTKHKLTLLKFIAVSTAAYYLYHKTRAQGGTLQGRINSHNIANLGAQLFPVEYRPQVKKYGSQIINHLISR